MKNPNKRLLSILFAGCFILILFCILGCLNKTGSLILLWQKDDLNSIRADSGLGAYAFIPNEDTARFSLPVYLMEDDRILISKPLAVNEDAILSVKEYGEGRYTVLENNSIYFSSTDASIPGDGTHEYHVLTPKIIRMRYLLPLCLLGAIGAAFLAVFYFLKGRKEADLNEFCGNAFRKMLSASALVFLFLCLLPTNASVFTPFRFGESFLNPVLQRNLPFMILGLSLCALMTRRKKPSLKFKLLMIAGMILSSVFYFAPEWNYYGTRSDTYGYIEKHSASSIRTVGYPRFVETVLKQTGKEHMEYWRSSAGKEELTQRAEYIYSVIPEDNSRGLIWVARAQKVCLALSLFLSWAMLSTVVSPWILFLLLQLILGRSFLGVYSSYILSENLSQALILPACAAFILLIVKRKPVWYLMLALCAGLAILVRPANTFLALAVLIGTICVFRIKEKNRNLYAAFGILVFLLCITQPAREIHAKYHRFLWMPVSGYMETGQALSIMKDADIENFEDPECKEFLRGSMRKATALSEAPETLTQNDWVWNIAIPQTEEMGLDQIESSWLFAKIYPAIYKAHFPELMEKLSDSAKLALERTRITGKRIGYLPILALFLVLAFIRRSRLSMSGLLMLLLHNAHVLISIMNQPERRYIYSTEILFLIGAALIIQNLLTPRKHSENPD